MDFCQRRSCKFCSVQGSISILSMAAAGAGGGLGATAAAAAAGTATAIEDLPADVLALVLRRLDGASLAAVGCACSGLRSASTCGPPSAALRRSAAAGTGRCSPTPSCSRRWQGTGRGGRGRMTWRSGRGGTEGGKKEMHTTGGFKDKVIFSSSFELQNI